MAILAYAQYCNHIRPGQAYWRQGALHCFDFISLYYAAAAVVTELDGRIAVWIATLSVDSP